MKAQTEPIETDAETILEPAVNSSVVSLVRPINFRILTRWFSDECLTKKATLNALAAALDYGARLIVGFIINPILLGGLGTYLYGLWQILGKLFGYVSAASGRPTQALKFTVASQQASTNHKEKCRNVGSAVAVWLLFLPLLAVAGGLMAWFAPAWLNIPVNLSWTVRLAAGLLVADLMMTSLAEVPRSVLQGENLGYRRMGLSTILVFVGGGLTAIALYLGTGIVGVALANLGETLLTGALFLRVVRRYVPWFGIAMPSSADVRKFFGLSWWFLAWRLVSQLMMASDIVVLGMLNSIETVSVYTLTKYSPETLTSLVAILVGGITPGLGGIIGAGNFDRAVRVREEIMCVTWLVITVIGTTILLWNRSFVQLWVKQDYYAGSVPTLLIVLMVMQFILIRNDAFIIDLTLNLRDKVLIGALSAAVSLIIAGVLVGSLKLGIPGLCLGFMAGRSILSLGYPWLIGRFLGIGLLFQLKGVLRPTFVTIVLLMLVLRAGDILTARTWISFVFSVALTLVGVTLLAFYTGLSGGWRSQILRRAKLLVQPAFE